MLSIEEIKLLIEKLEKAKAQDLVSLLETSINDLKTIKELIERTDKATGSFSSKGQSWFRYDLEEKKNIKQDEPLYLAIKEKIWHFAKTNMYNSLEIGSGHGTYSKLFLAWHNQFFLELLPETEKVLRNKFNLPHQKKYVKFFTTDNHSCGSVPTGAVNFVFSWDTFVFFTKEQINEYLASIYNILIPGGYVMIQYSDCHFDVDLEQSKKGYWAYNNKSIMKELIEENNFSIIELDQFKPGQNYAIFKKPGNVNSIVYNISELELD